GAEQVLCQSCEKGGGSGLNGFFSHGSTPSRKACCPLNKAISHKAHGVFDTENTELWEAPPRLRRSAVAQKTPDRGRRLADDLPGTGSKPEHAVYQT
ncbi:hypothetical protein, partial [Pseudomonas viridiflava]|uniref:hypothetical protein n=1 Tax=Pseudomonas viridiflava TaxID=33069 RepID=UPI0019D231DC